MSVRVKVPATTANLGPCFDTLGLALDYYNIVEIAECLQGLTIQVEGEGVDLLPTDQRNLVYRAAKLVFDEVGYQPPGLRIKLVNKIPLSRGMGSSSAAIVGGIVAANAIIGNKLSTERMLELATQIEGHPDNVTPALLGGFTVASVQEGKIYTIKLLPPAIKAIVVIPNFHLPTEKARAALPKQVSLSDAVFNVNHASLLVAALATGNLALLKIAMQDRLHQPYRTKLIPGMNDVLAAAKDAGALATALSGAGPTLIAFAAEKYEAISQAMSEAFRMNKVECRTMILGFNTSGAMLIHE